jgi:hypothetical protein
MACYYFKYTPATGSPLYLEDEPIKWDAVKIVLKRDRDWHGVNYEYTDGDISLEFDCLSGSDFIEQIYQSQGGDGYIGFEFGYYDGATEIPEFTGKINLATRKLLPNYRIGAMLERDGLHDMIKSRYGTKADLFDSVSIDGEAISAPPQLDLELHSKVLINNYNKTTGVAGTTAWEPFIGDEKHDIWFVFDTQPENEIDSNIDATIGSLLGPTGDDPVGSQLALLFDLNLDGNFTFNINLSYAFNIKLTRKAISVKPKIGDWFLDNWLEVRDLSGAIKERIRIGTQASGFRDGQFLNDTGSVNWSGSLSTSINLVYGDRVYLYAHFNLDGFAAGWKGVEAYIKTYSTEINVQAETNTGTSSAKVVMIHEALTQAIAYITGQDDAVYSKFFGREDLGYDVTGCGAYKAVTNGFQIRKFTAQLAPPKISFQELMTVNGIFCLGMGYEQISGENKVRIEERGYFYQDVEIMFIPTIGNYAEEVATDKIHNTIQVGYTKYLDEGIRLLDEYNTEHQYTAPIKNSDQPLDLRSVLITSGYAIEVTRRSQYADTPKDSTKYDDDGFLIAAVPQPIEPVSGTFVNDAGAYILYSGTLPLVVLSGDTILIDGTVSNDGFYTVMADPVDNRIYVGTFAVTPESGTFTLTNVSRPYTAEKDEAFDLVTGVVSPETSYNLRHTPKRNLLNHAKWLNGGMYYKSAGDLVRNTFVKQNGELTTQLDPGEPCPLGDINYDVLQEKADIVLAQFQEKDYFFIPEYISFKARISMSDVRFIRDCMTGQNLTGQNYGYITCQNQAGDYVRSWIYDMTYNPFNEEVNFVCLKKEVILRNPPSPFICTDYADFTFADFEALPNLSIDIEQCRFENFN